MQGSKSLTRLTIKEGLKIYFHQTAFICTSSYNKISIFWQFRFVKGVHPLLLRITIEVEGYSGALASNSLIAAKGYKIGCLYLAAQEAARSQTEGIAS